MSDFHWPPTTITSGINFPITGRFLWPMRSSKATLTLWKEGARKPSSCSRIYFPSLKKLLRRSVRPTLLCWPILPQKLSKFHLGFSFPGSTRFFQWLVDVSTKLDGPWAPFCSGNNFVYNFFFHVRSNKITRLLLFIKKSLITFIRLLRFLILISVEYMYMYMYHKII